MKNDRLNNIHNSILQELIEGKIKAYWIEDRFAELTGFEWKEVCKHASLIRLNYLEHVTGKRYQLTRDAYIPTENTRKRTTGIEQKIGGAITPLGFVGPLVIHGEYARGEFFIPLATNEAALVAGLNRGVSAINSSGGVNTAVTFDGMTRAPVIEMPNLTDAKKLATEIISKGKLYAVLKESAEKKSRYTKLIDIKPYQMGRYVWLRFVFQTGNAMGMNSATRYTADALETLLAERKDAKLISLSGNMCTDKKPSHINVLEGRGKSVHAEVVVAEETLKEIYGVDTKAIEKVNMVKNYLGSGYAGTMSGFNANAANTVAAIFIATGQDVAEVVNSSDCFTVAEALDNGSLRFSVFMPGLHVGTVGGGTQFGTAKEMLDLLGCNDPDKEGRQNARKLAEIIAAAVTAQELNLLATEANKLELAESHIRLARGER